MKTMNGYIPQYTRSDQRGLCTQMYDTSCVCCISSRLRLCASNPSLHVLYTQVGSFSHSFTAKSATALNFVIRFVNESTPSVVLSRVSPRGFRKSSLFSSVSSRLLLGGYTPVPFDVSSVYMHCSSRCAYAAASSIYDFFTRDERCRYTPFLHEYASTSYLNARTQVL